MTARRARAPAGVRCAPRQEGPDAHRLGSSRGRLGTKIQVAADAFGNPVRRNHSPRAVAQLIGVRLTKGLRVQFRARAATSVMRVWMSRDLGVEVSTGPPNDLGVLLMVWIRDRIQELAVAPRTADVLGRAAPMGRKQPRVGDAGHRLHYALDLDRVLPAIPEIVKVAERYGARVLDHVGQPRFAGVERPVTLVRVRHAPAGAASPDLVEVAVGPSECRLQHQVQVVKPDRQRHLDLALHLGPDLVERDLEACDAGAFMRPS